MTKTDSDAGEAVLPRVVPPLMTATWEAATTDPDPLAALGASRALVGLLSTWEARLVGEAVAAGATWEVIGGTVGVSRQAAWERFHDDVHEFRRRVKSDFHELRDRHRQEMLELRKSVKSEARGRRPRSS
ncbi:MAG TPA: hypothetical protein VNC61_00315 [Acidimicrobiales bacterium]|nr:hypothetical protein [Acidimicrobiales bacterium]